MNSKIHVHSQNDFIVLPLYASMPPEDQMKVFMPNIPNRRKFILSTNVAETSVTVPDVKYIIDSGFVKTRLIHPVTGFEMLKTIPISKAQANQRAGRAGRTCPGKCYRIYMEAVYNGFESVTMPEIQRVNMTQVVLQLMDMNIPSIMDFPLISRPTMESIKNAYGTLLLLGAIDKNKSLTPHGRNMAQLPLYPVLSHLLLKSNDYRCVNEIVTAVSMLSADNVFQQPYTEQEKSAADRAKKAMMVPEGDLLTLVNVYEQWKEVYSMCMYSCII